MAPAADPSASPQTAGFTLVELLVASSICVITIAAVLTAFLFFTRTGISIGNWHDFEAHNLRVVETFARDVRQADQVEWDNAHRLQLTVVGENIVYVFDSEAGTLARRKADGTVSTLASDLVELNFLPYGVDGEPLPLWGNLSDTSMKTKMIRIGFTVERGIAGGPSSRASLSSSRYMLRNKLMP